MFENIPVKVDSVGRMVIPKNIRKMYNIDKNSLLFLSLERDQILFIKDESQQKLNSLLEKLTRLEKHNFCFVVMKNVYIKPIVMIFFRRMLLVVFLIMIVI